MSEKAISYIVYGLKAGLFVLPALSLIVAGTLFFPFIAGKNFFFLILTQRRITAMMSVKLILFLSAFRRLQRKTEAVIFHMSQAR